MKVLWVADYTVKHNIGGAQRTNDLVIQEGIKRGFDIEYFTFESKNDLLSNHYDLVVSNNLEYLNRNKSLFEFITSHPNHVRFEHDANAYLEQEKRKTLFSSTIKNIFLSQYHLEVFKSNYGDIFHNNFIVAPPIDSSVFYDMGLEREDKTLSVGFLHPLKGTYNLISEITYNPDKSYVIAGWGPNNLINSLKSFNNVEFLGAVDHSQMPLLLNKYKRLYYHPKGFEPFCRAVGEAVFCGMEIDCNDIIGAFHSFNSLGRESFIEESNNSSQKFWDIVCQ